MIPQASAEFYRTQQRIKVATVAGVRRAWSQLERRWDSEWLDQLPQVYTLLSAAQLAAARSAGPYVAAVLEETGQVAPAQATLAAGALAGIASDGRPLETLLYQPLVAAGMAANAGAAPTRALGVGRDLLDLIVQTQIADSARVATQTWMTARNIQGYVRMLNPPSCDRCVVLAGKWFKWNAGFDRHPGDDCIHIPAREADYGDFRLSPDKYFHSLSKAEQDRIFGEGNAEAIRLGSDVGQVVNAKRGMTKASGLLGKGAAAVGIRMTGKEQLFTTEGTTRRGIFGRAELARGGAATRHAEELAARITRRGAELRRIHRTRTRRARMMPESIIDLANGDQAEAVRLLKLYGYLI